MERIAEKSDFFAEFDESRSVKISASFCAIKLRLMTTESGNTLCTWDEEFDLISGLESRNRKACSAAYRQYHPAMVRVASQYVDTHLAEDVAHDAWIAALRGIKQFQRRSSLKTWLCRITKHCALNAYRKGQKQHAAELMENAAIDDELCVTSDHNLSWPEREVHYARVNARVRGKMMQMNKTQANALYFSSSGTMDGQQISDALSVSHANLRVILHRARAELAGVL